MCRTLSWSGGKDSTASIILSYIKGEPIDYILIAEPMFSLDSLHPELGDISAELPSHTAFVHYAKGIFEDWGFDVRILRSETDYLSIFEHTIKSDSEHNGMQYGFPIAGMCAFKRDCKLRQMNKFLNSLDTEITEIVGIAIDEPRRLKSLHRRENKLSLLEKYNMTERDAYELCESYGLLAPNYQFGSRGGCICCPFAKEHELKEWKYGEEKHQRAYQKLLELEAKANDPSNNIAFSKWNTFGRTLIEIDSRI